MRERNHAGSPAVVALSPGADAAGIFGVSAGADAAAVSVKIAYCSTAMSLTTINRCVKAFKTHGVAGLVGV